MINPHDSIRYTNVVSRKYRFHYKEMENVLRDFQQDVLKLGTSVKVKGPLFYSINNVPMDEVIHGEFFLPVHQDNVRVMEDMQFHSYFSIENMVSHCLFAHFESLTEVSYRILFDYMSYYHLIQNTPIFHVISGDKSLNYVFIKIGVVQQKNQEVWR